MVVQSLPVVVVVVVVQSLPVVVVVLPVLSKSPVVVVLPVVVVDEKSKKLENGVDGAELESDVGDESVVGDEYEAGVELGVNQPLELAEV